MKSQSTVIQGSFPGGRPFGPALVRRPPQPGKPIIQPAGSTQAMQIDPALLNLGASLGKPLPEAVQRKMETFFGTNFSDVRVFMGPQASSIGALAFTLGSNIYFAPGQYDPHSVRGQQVLGHELTHVIQQRAGRVRNPQGFGIAVVQDHALEAEADRLGMRAAAQPLPAGHPSPAGAGMVQPQRAQPPAHRPVQPKLAGGLPGTRPVAPHVQAAIAAGAQPKVSATQTGGRPLAPHVQAAIAAGAQPKLSAAQPGGRPLAPHVQAAVAAVGQPKLPNAQPGGRPLAPHVQAAIATGAQPKLSAAQPGGRPVVPPVQAAVAVIDKPAHFQATVNTPRTEIQVVAGQEKHPPLAAWHAVQQKQGWANSTLQGAFIAIIGPEHPAGSTTLRDAAERLREHYVEEQYYTSDDMNENRFRAIRSDENIYLIAHGDDPAHPETRVAAMGGKGGNAVRNVVKKILSKMTNGNQYTGKIILEGCHTAEPVLNAESRAKRTSLLYDFQQAMNEDKFFRAKMHPTARIGGYLGASYTSGDYSLGYGTASTEHPKTLGFQRGRGIPGVKEGAGGKGYKYENDESFLESLWRQRLEFGGPK